MKRVYVYRGSFEIAVELEPVLDRSGSVKLLPPRGHFPNDEAAIKLLWLALRNVLAKTVRTAFDWKSAMNQFAILFGERFMQARG